MNLKRYAAALLLAALALALLTPAYVAYAVPSQAVYHRNGFIFVTQVVPYALCAAVWLPSRNPSAPRIVLVLSVLLFIAACALYIPRVLRPGPGGDMVGLGYILVCLVTTSAIAAISVIAVAVTWWQSRQRRSA